MNHKIKQVFNFFKNIIEYRKFLWNSGWWDYDYLLEMVQIKLDIDSKYYLKEGHCLNSNDVAKEMEYCSILISKIRKDEYCNNILLGYYTTADFREADDKKQEDFDKLFNYMSNHVRGWWD